MPKTASFVHTSLGKNRCFATLTKAFGIFSSWDEVEREAGIQLVFKTGGLAWTTPETGQMPYIDATVECLQANGKICPKLDSKDINTRVPELTVPSSARGVFDPEAGLVDAAMANQVHQQLAESRGAVIKQNVKLLHIHKAPDDSYQLVTSKGTFRCRKIIVAAGAWINEVLSNFATFIPVKVSQEQVTYIATPNLKAFTKDRFPVVMYASPTEHIYSLPIHGVAAYKVGIDAAGHAVTGDTRTFEVNKTLEERVFDYVGKFTPKGMGRVKETKVCLYTMTYDREYVIDDLRSKGHPNVIVCCGGGHAFKMASILGKILAEMAISGHPETVHDLTPFRLDRPAITDPHFTPLFIHNAQHVNMLKSKV